MTRLSSKIVCLIGCLLLCWQLSFAQNNPLQRTVSLNVNQQSMHQALQLLADRGNFSFAYNSSLINTDTVITYSASHVSVSKVLTDLLGQKIEPTVLGQHVVLKAKVNPNEPPKSDFMVSGKVTNSNTGQVIENVSLYSNVKLKSDLTDREGQYILELKPKQAEQLITVSKVGFKDTTFSVSQSEIYNLNLSLTPLPEYTDSSEKVEKMGFVNFLTNAKQRIHAFNVKDSINRVFQISLVPIIGTNYKLSGAVTNRVSLNIIGGYNGGVKGVELAGGFNIIRRHVKGVQLAGGGNMVGGNVQGLQAAGGYNFNLGNFKGTQLAGGLNMQTYELNGWQAAGGLNIVGADMTGSQMAGGLNITAGNVEGAQFAGGLNFADSLKGVQMAGGLNVAHGKVSGMQIAPVNVAGQLSGVQLGVVNFANECSGVPIGLLSFVRKGYLHADVYGDETTHFNISLRTGVSRFHNIVTAGAGFQISDTSVTWRVGYGVGAEFSFGKQKKGFTSTDLTVSYVNKNADFITDLNLLISLNWDIGYRFKSHLAIYAGPSLKWYVSKYQNPETGQLGLDLAWNSIYRNENNGLLNELWVGVHGGLRF